MVHEINDSNFDAFIEENDNVLVDCWAPWCGPCRRIAPIMEELSRDLAGRVAVAKLNVDESPGISARFSISAIPTLLMFSKGVLVQTLVGLRDKKDIMAIMQSAGMITSSGASAPAAAPADGAPVQLTDVSFNNFIKSSKLALVDCWAPWCGPCRRIAPIIDELAADSDGIAVGKLNTDENRAVMKDYSIESIPTLLMFKDGELVDTIIGLSPNLSAEMLKNHMKEL